MNRTITRLAGFAALGVLTTAGMISTAAATNHKPLNAAETEKGLGCIVRANETDPYQVDLNCSYHTVIKRDKDGNLVSFRYQDKGELQPGQTAGDRAVRTPVSQVVFGSLCHGTEVVTPSGRYSSSLTCNY